MRDSDYTTRRLQTCDTNAWETFLSHRLDIADLIVEQVTAEQVETRRLRFIIKLAGHSDPITMIGKRRRLWKPVLSPFECSASDSCPTLLVQFADTQSGWIVIDDVPHDRVPTTWLGGDTEDVIRQLARLHTTFWDQGRI